MVVDSGGGMLWTKRVDDVCFVADDATKSGNSLTDSVRFGVAERKPHVTPPLVVGKKGSAGGVGDKLSDRTREHVFRIKALGECGPEEESATRGVVRQARNVLCDGFFHGVAPLQIKKPELFYLGAPIFGFEVAADYELGKHAG